MKRVKKTLETFTSSRINRKITKADSAVSAKANIGDNIIIALEYSALGISLIMTFTPNHEL